jgi:CubicO group peptidase (beta-lactamase class C family)
MSMQVKNLDKFDELIAPILRAARIPGSAIAVVVGDEPVFIRSYGLRDLSAQLQLGTDTLYPIASTTKSMNATLLGVLVDEGRLSWDEPVQTYMPGFRLGSPQISAQITLRDLLIMRTGLPRHDWMWSGRRIERAELVECMRHLQLSAGFRERFQYSNLTVTAAGHLAEIVAGREWEELLRERILMPLGMRDTSSAPSSGNRTRAYHDSCNGELKLTDAMEAHATLPSGGGLHSTIADMTRWVAFNLTGGMAQGRQLIRPQTLEEIRAPKIVIDADQSPPTPGAARAMGWTVDRYQGCARVSHAGYLWDVSSDVSLYPEHNVGFVAFNNFGRVWRAKLINQFAFELLMGFSAATPWEHKIAEYERNVEETRRRNAAAQGVQGTSPSHPLRDYVGCYTHPAYGQLEVDQEGSALLARFNGMLLTLQHWHYDAWVVADNDIFEIDVAHAFDRTNRWLFETNADGAIAAVTIPLESAVHSIRFERDRTRRC